MDTQTSTIALSRARALHELQLQQPVRLSEKGKILGTAFPAEFIDEAGWARLSAIKPQLLLSAIRARIAGIATTAIDAGGLTYDELQQWIAGDAKLLPKSSSIAPPAFANKLITLAKQAGIIPALVWIPKADAFSESSVFDICILHSEPPVELIRGETVSLPIEGAENATLTSFRSRYDAAVHLVLTIGDTKSHIPLVRVHSSCVTGDLLGSLRCDCGNQLQMALSQMKEVSSGILLYLHQEGRGIGISSKLRAYALQERGLDTFAANQQLGFEEDERDFSLAASILKAMGHTHIRLLTNNPDKIEAFASTDITVSERLPLKADPTSHNHAYLEAKKRKHGHS